MTGDQKQQHIETLRPYLRRKLARTLARPDDASAAVLELAAAADGRREWTATEWCCLLAQLSAYSGSVGEWLDTLWLLS